MTITELSGLAAAMYPKYAIWQELATAIGFVQFPLYLFATTFARCIFYAADLWPKGRAQYCVMLVSSVSFGTLYAPHAAKLGELILLRNLAHLHDAYSVSSFLCGATVLCAVVFTAQSFDEESLARGE
ncbi:MAG TPA: hypothetical protein VJL39_01245 [Candidatus Paceibacterota bacterium]